MKRFLVCITALALLFSLGLPVPAGEQLPGKVLYHQDFSVLSELELSGIVRGTSSAEKAEITCAGDTLELNTFDNERVYVLLPETKTEDSYTIEFDFSFSEIRSENAYIGFILTCRGTEPTNVTALVIRADGTIDDFDEPDEALMKAIADGGKIQVKIPVKKNVLHTVELTADGKTYVLERDNVKVLGDGGRGFVVRNTSVDVSEIFIADGTGYTEKYGEYAKSSYASDSLTSNVATIMLPSSAPVPADTTEVTVTVSPDTGEMIVPYAAAAAVIAVGLFRRKKIYH